MKWVVSGILVIIFLIWGISTLRYFFSRINLLIQLQRIKGSSKDAKLKFKSGLSLFGDVDTKTSQILLYIKGTLYIIKLCGCFRKMTDIVALDSNRWQMFSTLPFTLPNDKDPLKKATDITLDFKLNQEKQAIESVLGGSAVINNIRNVILFTPKPAGFYTRIHGNNEAVGFGAEWNSYLIASVQVLKDIVKNSEQVNSNISITDWDRITKEYRKIK
jgi:hypothetical protein